MSATNRGLARLDQDAYPTPKWCVKRLLEAVPLPGGHWLEPCAGEGAIINAAPESGWGLPTDRTWTAIEVRPECKQALTHCAKHVHIDDFLARYGPAREINDDPVFDVAITNPPYSLAQEIIEVCLRIARITVMLLRVNFLGSQKRCLWLRQYTPSVYVLPNRPGFALNKHGKVGTDATEYAWLVWGANSDHGFPDTSLHILNLTPDEELEEGRRDLRAWVEARSRPKITHGRIGRVAR